MNAATRATVGRIVDRAAYLAVVRDNLAARAINAASLDRSAVELGQAAAVALDVDLCAVAASLSREAHDAPDADTYAAALWRALGQAPAAQTRRARP